MSPRTVTDTLSFEQRLNPTLWPVPEMPDVPIEPWHKDAGAFWRRRTVHGDVDQVRTDALRVFDDIGIGFVAGNTPWQGSSYGKPYNLLPSDTPLTPVWDIGRAPTFRWSVVWNGWWPSLRLVRSNDPIYRLPLPPLVRREGDPLESSDSHWTGLSSTQLVEAIQLHRNDLNPFRTFHTTDWTCGYDGGGRGASIWDTTRPWDSPGQPHGAVATGVPAFPMLIRWDQVRAAAPVDGTLGHVMFLGVPNYDRTFEGAARGSDGDLEGFPLRGGTILRLRPDVVDRYEPGTIERVIARTAHEYGMFVGDRNAWRRGTFSGGSGCAMAMDRRFVHGDATLPGLTFGYGFRLHDCEIIAPQP